MAIQKIACNCHIFTQCPLCQCDNLYYLEFIDHLVDCIPQYTTFSIFAQEYDIFLYIIGVKDTLDCNTNLKSIRNLERIRAIYSYFYLLLGGSVEQLSENYFQFVILDNVEIFILNCIETSSIELKSLF